MFISVPQYLPELPYPLGAPQLASDRFNVRRHLQLREI